jgi:hypothetical protein
LKTKSGDLIAAFVILASAFVAYAAGDYIYSEKPERPPTVLMPPEYIDHFAFGFEQTLADTLWIRVIQNFDFCEYQPGERKGLKVSAEGKQCSRGWVYRMLDAITQLDPKFRVAYTHGSTILSVGVGDVEGARLMFEKGMQHYPSDWQLKFRAAYHYLYEVKDNVRAAELLNESASLGAPFWVVSLAAKLYSKAGQALLGKQVLLEYLEKNPEGRGADRARVRLKEIEEILESSESNQ